MGIARSRARRVLRSFLVCPFMLNLALWTGDAAADPLTAPARVLDGATIEVAGVIVKLSGVTAPTRTEICTRSIGAGTHALPWLARVPYPCGYEAVNALQKLIGDRVVICHPQGYDGQGHVVAWCSTGDIPDIAAALARGK